ncbi:MAG: S-layer family protein, partial [Phycisphaerae bacterium]|nr:S-layer family protein [Phycisphaerae bacterium]
GTVTVGGNATFTTGNANDDITLDQLAVTGSIALNTTGATGHATIVNATGIALGTGTVGGNLSATATTGDITDVGLVNVLGGATFTTSQANADITLDQLVIGGEIGLHTTGATGHASITSGTSVVLASSAVGGNLSVTAFTGDVTDSGTVIVGGNASFTTSNTNDDITLDQLAVSGTVALNTTGATGHATVVNASALNLAASTIGGNLSATAATGNVTDSGTITVGGNASFTASNTNDDIVVDQLAVAGTVAVNTTGSSGNASIVNATALNLAASNVGGNLSATATTGNVTDAGTITVGGNAAFSASNTNDDIVVDQIAVAGDISVNTTGATGHAVVINNGGINFASSNVGGNLTVTALGGDITDSGVVTVGQTARFTTSQANADIVLDQLATGTAVGVNTTGSTGHATIVNASSGGLVASNVGGNLSFTAASGNITSLGLVNVGGNASFATGATNATIYLNQLDAGGTVALSTTGSGGHATVIEGSSLNLATSNVGGNLIARATTGNVFDSGTVTVGGSASFRTLNADDDIVLDQLAVTGPISVMTTGAGGMAILRNATAVDLAAGSVGGNLRVNAASGNITDSGTVTILGNAFFTTEAANARITLDQINATRNIALTTSGTTGHATLINTSGINFAATAIGGDLIATARAGNIVDLQTVTVGRNAVFTTQQANGKINVDQVGITGSASLNTTGVSGNATIVNAGTLLLGASDIGGSLLARATTGNLIDVGTVRVAGSARFITAQLNRTINVNELDVTGGISLATSGAGAHAVVVNSRAVFLGASNVGGNLSVTATTGGITDTGAINVGGSATFRIFQSGSSFSIDQVNAGGAIVFIGP